MKVGDTVSWQHSHRSGLTGYRHVVWTGEIIKVYPRWHILANYVRIKRYDKTHFVHKRKLVWHDDECHVYGEKS